MYSYWFPLHFPPQRPLVLFFYLLFFFLRKKIIFTYVDIYFNFNLVSYLKTYVRFEDTAVWINDVFEWSNLYIRLLSSANKVNLNKFVEPEKSFIKTKNRIGLKMDCVIDCKSEAVLLIYMYRIVFDQIDTS